MKILRSPMHLIAFILSLAAQGATAAPVIAQVNYLDSMPVSDTMFAIWSATVVDSDTRAPIAGVHYRYSADTSCASFGASGAAEGYTDGDGLASAVLAAVAPSLACATMLEVDGAAPVSQSVHTFLLQNVVITPEAAAIDTVVNGSFTVTVHTTESGLPVNTGKGQISVTPSPNGASATLGCCVQAVNNSGIVSIPFLGNGKQGHYTITVGFAPAPPATVDVTQKVKR
jgi:hypothetical protein